MAMASWCLAQQLDLRLNSVGLHTVAVPPTIAKASAMQNVLSIATSVTLVNLRPRSLRSAPAARPKSRKRSVYDATSLPIEFRENTNLRLTEAVSVGAGGRRLLPVNTEKRISNGQYIFPIAGRDDDETANVRGS